MGKKDTSNRSIINAEFLGDCALAPHRFENLEAIFSFFRSEEYLRLNHKFKSEKVNQTLLEQILKAPDGIFLLPAVIDFIDQIARNDFLIHYTLASFEIWLNQFSTLSERENYQVRAKIVGKGIPRDEYQILFPIGMGKIHPGSHFVTAHASPDLDTTVASFWGWVDAFGARVSEGVHVWNVPGGPPTSSIEVALLFQQIFGQNVFKHIAKTYDALTLSSLELMTQRGVVKQQTDQSSLMIDHERTQKAVILVDQWGYFLGDWRSFDVEGVRQVIMMLNNCLRWFENHLQIHLVSFFAKEKLQQKDVPNFVKEIFGVKIKDCPPTHELTKKQQRYMESYLQKVLKVEKGASSTFEEFATSMKGLAIFDFYDCFVHVKELANSDLFDAEGDLVEERPRIFHHLEEILAQLDSAIGSVRNYTERLEVALKIKFQVFGYLPQVISYRAEVDELKSKMGNYPYLTVTSTDDEGKMIPLGVVRARDLQQTTLGTVTLRDFCNRDETKIPSYLEVISVIDHHKTQLNTSAAPVVYISDAQSSNSVVAELAFQINDRYSTGGMTREQILSQIDEVKRDLAIPSQRRLLKKLLLRMHAEEEQKNWGHFIDPLREFVEYLHFLYAILDDTDLLTKVSKRDVECVAELLNRMKSLTKGKVVEILSFDDLPKDETFVAKAATRILKQRDMYSMYRKIYIAKEQLLEEQLALAAEGKEITLFADTKLQNGCVRIGQTKMFSNNFDTFQKQRPLLCKRWVEDSLAFFEDRREFDLHLHMISTIAGAEDLFSGENGQYHHKDELWIWIPMTDQSVQHLMSFLNAFCNSPRIVENEKDLEIELLGEYGKELKTIFSESFPSTPCKMVDGQQYSMAILRYPAGAINSRKAMISPYLPKPIT
jgi:hypothetical protein